MEYLRVFEAFSGYGSQSMALKRLGIKFEVIGISEIDPYAIQAYNAIHGKTRNYGDISKIDWDSVPDFDFFTYSFPCTDISSAGRQKGLKEGSGTRSSLLWECKKAIEAKKPKYMMMENVKALTSGKFLPYLHKWLSYLEYLGYSNFTKVLNAKDYGIPQNRERVFVISIIGEEKYSFPKPFRLIYRLKDFLEQNVDESFYLSKKIVGTFLKRNENNNKKSYGFKFEPTMGENIASTIGTHPNDRDCNNYVYVVGNTNPSGHGMNGNVFSSNGLSPTITTNKGEGPRILELLKYGNKRVQSLVDSGKISGDKIEFIDAYNQKVSEICGTIKTTVYSSSMSFITEPFSIEPKCVGYTRNSKGKVVKRHLTDIANTIHGSTGSGGNTDCFVYNNFRIRKLTPRECFRLMGVSDEDIDKIQAAGISKTQQYKMAGNSIVVDVLYHIFRKMFINKKDENQQLSLF